MKAWSRLEAAEAMMSEYLPCGCHIYCRGHEDIEVPDYVPPRRRFSDRRAARLFGAANLGFLTAMAAVPVTK